MKVSVENKTNYSKFSIFRRNSRREAYLVVFISKKKKNLIEIMYFYMMIYLPSWSSLN